MNNTNMPGENLLTRGYTNSEWENFVKGELIVIMEKHGLEKIEINDGCGRKGKIAKNKNGEYKTNITLSETL